MSVRPLLPAALAVVLASGCERRLDLACAHDPHGWYDNATYTLLNGGTDGAFDFDPVGDPITRRAGKYAFKTGDYQYTDTYHRDHWTARVVTEGYGTIYDNGNLDILHKRTTTDVLGEVWATLVRVERQRCSGTITTTDFDENLSVDDDPPADAESLTWETTIVSDEEVRMDLDTTLSGMPYVAEVRSTPDIAERRTVDWGNGDYRVETTWRYDGTGASEWAQNGSMFGSDYDYAGDNEYYFDGSYLETYDVIDEGDVVGTWSLLYQYDGSAAGTYVSGGFSCDVVIETDGDCTAECSDGETYDCG